MILRFTKEGLQKRQNGYLSLGIAGLILQPMYFFILSTLSDVFLFETGPFTYLYYGAVWFLLLLSLPGLVCAVTPYRLLGILVVGVLITSQLLFFPNNEKYISGINIMEVLAFQPTSLLTVIPYIWVGMAVTDTDKLRGVLQTTARIGILIGALTYVIAIINDQELNYDDMNNAYGICLMVCLLIMEPRKRDSLFIVIGVLSLILAGTRGPLVCFMVAVAVKTVWLEPKLVAKVVKTILCLLVIILLFLGATEWLLEGVAEIFALIGVKDLRIVDFMREGILLDSSERIELTKTIRTAIGEKPLLGYGAGGDRTLLFDGTYAHNLFLELWVSYGLLCGTLIIGWMGYWVFRALFHKSTEVRFFAAVLFSGVVVKLLLSSSYLNSKELFVLLGVCIAGTPSANKKRLH